MIRIYGEKEIKTGEIFERTIPTRDVSAAVSVIIADVRKRGDAALKEYALRFDGVKTESIEVGKDEIEAAYERTDGEFKRILIRARDNVTEYHEKQIRKGYELRREGVILGQRIVPVDRAGVYVPGGTAAYPSTVIMDTVPENI